MHEDGQQVFERHRILVGGHELQTFRRPVQCAGLPVPHRVHGVAGKPENADLAIRRQSLEQIGESLVEIQRGHGGIRVLLDDEGDALGCGQPPGGRPAGANQQAQYHAA